MHYESEKLNARFGEMKKYIDPSETVIAGKSIKVYCKKQELYSIHLRAYNGGKFSWKSALD